MDPIRRADEIHEEVGADRGSLPFISVVLCTYDRPDMLRDALESLAVQQTGGRFRYEIVVVYSGAAEPPLAVVEDIKQRTGVPLRAVHEPRRGQVVARNRAIEEAEGVWLAHFDDDQLADPCWLKELMATAVEKNALVVGGALWLKLPEGCDRALSWQCRRMLGESVDWKTVRPYTRKEGPGTGNLMVHRRVFEEVGQYDESFRLRGYDTDLFRRIREAGIEAWFTPHAFGYHVTPASRLTNEFFHEACLHNGWQFARRDLLDVGLAKTIVFMAARLAQAALLLGPRWLAARLFGSEEDILTARCRLWRTAGYVRSTLYGIAPAVFPQRRFFERYEFRAQRQEPAESSPPVAAVGSGGPR